MTSFPLTTTLNRICACNPCERGWRDGLRAFNKTKPDDDLITYEQILGKVGLNNALWCCRAEPQHHNLWRRYAVWCANQVRHLMTDERSIKALDVAARHADGMATDEELAAARAAAWAFWSAAWAAWTAADPADAAADTAAWAAGWAALAAASAAKAAAGAAALAAADAAAWAADRDAQAAAFRQLVTTGTLPPSPSPTIAESTDHNDPL